jgi:putative FmdB family regulatory protein
MPLYEYSCNACDRDFETLVRAADTPECPSCHSTDLERRLSVFAAHSAGSGGDPMPAMSGCGHCGDPRGPGACSFDN